MTQDIVERLRRPVGRNAFTQEPFANALSVEAADTIAALRAEVETCKKYRDAYAECDRITTDALRKSEAERDRLRVLVRWAHDTLYELNPSNYDHDEVCRVNDAAVEVILGLAPVLGETHGKSPEWWAAITTKGEADDCA